MLVRCGALALQPTLDERRESPRRRDELRGAGAQLAHQGAHAGALTHPLAQDRARGAPDVELRIQLASQALHVEQRLLQQHELRLDLHVEAPRDLEQAQQDAPEGDVLERAVEDRFAHGAHRGLHLIDARVRRHPAGLQVQLRDAPVVAIEHRQEVLREVLLIGRIERADDAEIHGRVARPLRVIDQHEDVAGVHVGVEEVVAEHLREEDAHAVLGELRNVGAGGLEARALADRHAVDALHDHDVGAAVIPVHLRHVQQLGSGEVALQLRGVGGLAHQVELIENGLLVFRDQLARPQPPALRPVAVREIGERLQHLQIPLDHRAHARPQHLDHDLRAAGQARGVHLCDGGGGERGLIEGVEHLREGPSVGALDRLAGNGARKRRHAILQLGELVGDIRRQQVAARGDRLAELHENGSELLEREPQARGAAHPPAALEPHPGGEEEHKAQRPI